MSLRWRLKVFRKLLSPLQNQNLVEVVSGQTGLEQVRLPRLLARVAGPEEVPEEEVAAPTGHLPPAGDFAEEVPGIRGPAVSQERRESDGAGGDAGVQVGVVRTHRLHSERQLE